MTNYRPPDRLPYYPEHRRTERPMNQTPIVKLQKRTVKMLKHLCIVGILLTVAYAFFSMGDSYMGILYSPALVQIIVIFIGIFFAWQFLDNKLIWTIEVTPNVIRKRSTHNNIPKANSRQAQKVTNNVLGKTYTTFGFLSTILAIPLVVMVVIFMFVAVSSGTGITIVYWNKFGEMWTEVIVFSLCSVLVIIGAIINYKNWKATR